jgi:hypothetical protein
MPEHLMEVFSGTRDRREGYLVINIELSYPLGIRFECCSGARYRMMFLKKKRIQNEDRMLFRRMHRTWNKNLILFRIKDINLEQG